MYGPPQSCPTCAPHAALRPASAALLAAALPSRWSPRLARSWVTTRWCLPPTATPRCESWGRTPHLQSGRYCLPSPTTTMTSTCTQVCTQLEAAASCSLGHVRSLATVLVGDRSMDVMLIVTAWCRIECRSLQPTVTPSDNIRNFANPSALTHPSIHPSIHPSASLPTCPHPPHPHLPPHQRNPDTLRSMVLPQTRR